MRQAYCKTESIAMCILRSLGPTTVGPTVKIRKSNYFVYLLAVPESVFNVSDR